MVKVVLFLLGVLAVGFAVVLIKDLLEHKNQLEKDTSFVKAAAIGFGTNFLDALGIGNFATATALLRMLNQIEDRVIPGTLNVGFTLSVITEAFIFIAAIEVEPLTLVSMIAAATLGAWIGAGFVSRLPEKKVQQMMGISLLFVVGMMLAGKFGLMPTGGQEVGLSGVKLVVAIVVNFFLGALMTCGIGLYAPCMALVYALGMSPKVSFPVMFGSCAFLMPVASVRFVKEGAYNRKIALAFSTVGILGVIVAVTLVKSMSLDLLQWLVMAVVLYTALSMLKASTKKEPVPKPMETKLA